MSNGCAYLRDIMIVFVRKKVSNGNSHKKYYQEYSDEREFSPRNKHIIHYTLVGAGVCKVPVDSKILMKYKQS